MTYVTQGTVQVEIKDSGNNDLVIRINPSQDYAVKHEKKNYIVFMPNGSNNPNPNDAKVFETETPAKTNAALVEALIQAAFQSTKIEIGVDISGKKITIQSIKIPAISVSN